MRNDFVLAESEISIAVNKITNMSDVLSSSIDDYVTILSDLQTNGGIKDHLICSELNEIIALAKSYQGTIGALKSEISANIINPEIAEAESNDNFQFPSDFMTEVTYILSRFL